MTKCVVTFTRAELDPAILARATRFFGWEPVKVDAARQMRGVDSRRIAALLFDREAIGSSSLIARDGRPSSELCASSPIAHNARPSGELCASWLDCAAFLRTIAPGPRLIACHGFSEAIDWPALADAGVFHAIRLPLCESELRQSLGYVWSLEQGAHVRQVRSSRAAA